MRGSLKQIAIALSLLILASCGSGPREAADEKLAEACDAGVVQALTGRQKIELITRRDFTTDPQGIGRADHRRVLVQALISRGKMRYEMQYECIFKEKFSGFKKNKHNARLVSFRTGRFSFEINEENQYDSLLEVNVVNAINGVLF